MLEIIKNEINLIKLKHKTPGYTLAEMLMVMLIVSLMILALPPVTKKVYKITTQRKFHGRFECYRDSSGNIIQATSTEGGTSTASTVTDKCTFKLPSNSIYVLIHAIGGGGGGAYIKEAPVDGSVTITDESYQGNTLPNMWPDWLREIRNNGYQFPNNVPNNMDNLTKVTGNVATLQYGFSGLQGERISMFFSRLDPETEIEMIPGSAGTAGSSYSSYEGSDGTDTVVNFIKKNASGAKETKELIRAHGGTGGTVSGAAKVWTYGGYPSDFGVGELSARVPQDANFVETIEGNTDSSLKSYIYEEGLNPGDGGGGAYTFIKDTASTLTYNIEGTNITSKVSFNTYLEKNPRANTDCSGKGTDTHKCKADSSQPHQCYSNTKKKVCPGSSTAEECKEYVCTGDTDYKPCATHNASGSCVPNCSNPQNKIQKSSENFLCEPDKGGTGAVVILW